VNEKLKELEDLIINEIEKLAHSLKTRMHHLMHPEADAAKEATINNLKSKLAEIASGGVQSESDVSPELLAAGASATAVGAQAAGQNVAPPPAPEVPPVSQAADAEKLSDVDAEIAAKDKKNGDDPSRGQFIG
jgi:hypothetical protein